MPRGSAIWRAGNVISGTKIRRYAGPIVTILVGVVISLIAYALMLRWDRQVVRNEFIQEATNHFEAINRDVEFNLHTLSSLKTFYDSIGELNRTEFRDLSKHLLSLHSSVQAIEWIPRVPNSDRLACEEAARRAGFPHFQIIDRATSDEMIRATEREEYYPVYFVEPYRGNEVALGFDLASNPMCREALQRARDTGHAVATGRIKLVLQTAGRFGFLVFSPIYHKGLPADSIVTRRENLKGFTLGVFTVDEIVEKSLTYLKPAGIDIYLYDRSAASEESFLYFHPSRTRKTSNVIAEPATDAHFEHSRILTLPDREWLVLMKPAPGFISARETWYPLEGLLAGLLLTAALASYLIMQKQAKQTLQEQLNFLQSLIDTIPSPIFYKHINGLYLGCNTAFEAYIGRPKTEIVGKTVYDIEPEDLASVYHEADLALFLAPGVQNYEASVQYADGVPHDVLFTKATFSDAAGKIAGMVGVMVDITARKRAEEMTSIRLSLLEFAVSHSLGELLQKTLDEVGALTKSPIGFYHFVESDQKTLSLQGWSTQTVKEFCKAEGKGLHYSIDQAGVWVDCVHERRPVIHNDYSALSHRKGMPAGHAPVIRELVVPILRSGQMVAILDIGNKPTDYNDKDVEVVSYLADVA